jgi:hypothetical protein
MTANAKTRKCAYTGLCENGSAKFPHGVYGTYPHHPRLPANEKPAALA